MNVNYIECSEKMAETLKKLRERNSLSHQRLAIETGISKDSLMAYEASGNHSKSGSNYKMKAETLCALADYYEVSTDYLLGRTHVETPNISDRAICERFGIDEDALVGLSLCTGNVERGSLSKDTFEKFLSFDSLPWLLSRINKAVISAEELSETLDKINKRIDDALKSKEYEIAAGLSALLLRSDDLVSHVLEVERDLKVAKFDVQEYMTLILGSLGIKKAEDGLDDLIKRSIAISESSEYITYFHDKYGPSPNNTREE